MTGSELLTAGKAVLWFGLPLALAIWELVKLRRDRRCGNRDSQRLT